MPTQPKPGRVGPLSRGLILTIVLVAAALVILNVVVVSCYVKRRGDRKQLEAASSGEII